jgi:hypothetical protein
MAFLAQGVVWLNTIANAVGDWLLAPIGFLPAWLSTTLISVVTGVLLLWAFKYTSPQRAIKRVKDDIKANLLALKLFKDSAAVAVAAQGRILFASLRMLLLVLLPMALMLLPVSLLLAQLSLWYQARPLPVGEEALVTMKLNGPVDSAWPNVELLPSEAVQATAGPAKIAKNRELCWNIEARQSGYHRLQFRVNDRLVDKEVAVGDGFMRVSPERPRWDWLDALLNPLEQPFEPESPVQSIAIDYPERTQWTKEPSSWLLCWFDGAMFVADLIGGLCALIGGASVPAWIIYWFVVSMIGGLCFRRMLNVNI